MAMAYLFSTLLKNYRGIKIADNPAGSAFGIVIDHKLRDESTAEAARVARELSRLGLKAVIKSVSWREQRGMGVDPKNLPNVESLARTLRYQTLGATCRYLQSSSLFFAHHSDDQYETVLMRLLAGHGYRGLQGIRNANAIPECYELHGVYKSGLLDDQLQRFPFLSFKPPIREMRRARMLLQHDKKAEPWDHLRSYLGINDVSAHFPGHIARSIDSQVPYLTPLSSEDGGIMIYRPLLDFGKDRLIATCEANKVQWFEDHTNRDPTLTTRNAIRHLTRNHTLPQALQKPSIIALSQRAKRRARMEEAEAHRFLTRERVIKEFDPNAGTLLVELPRLVTKRPQQRRLFAQAREAARKPHRRLMAAIAVRKLIEFVTPERHSPPLSNLEKVIDRLFPEISFNPGDAAPTLQSKAFSIAGVLFEPVTTSGATRWFISRAPYVSNQPQPERKLPGFLNYSQGITKPDTGDHPNRHGHWRGWKTAKMWDGRFWIRVSACVAARFHVLPFVSAHAKPFRMALRARERARFERVLKHYAPGKVRYSLPALYSAEPTADNQGEKTIMTLLALPSLGIHVPGLERWVRYEVRYKNVDITLLGGTRSKRKSNMMGYRRVGSVSRQWRRNRAKRDEKGL